MTGSQWLGTFSESDREKVLIGVENLAGWWEQVCREGFRPQFGTRKKYTRSKPVRRGYKRGPYAKNAADGMDAEAVTEQ